MRTDFDPFQAQVVREGTDATIVAYGPLVPVALAAAEAAVEDGRSIEVIDLRSISPMDVPTVAASVVKTGRLIVAHEAPTFGGMGGELAAAITERCFYSLQAPVLRVGGYYMPYPVRIKIGVRKIHLTLEPVAAFGLENNHRIVAFNRFAGHPIGVMR